MSSGSQSVTSTNEAERNAISEVKTPPIASAEPTPEKQDEQENSDGKPKRGMRFWLIYVALCVSVLLAALDLASVATAAPTIVSDLHGEDFTWVASAYSLASAACLPFSGKLAQIFGRRPAMLGALVIFAAGSAVSGSATSMNVLLVGRAIQGVGCGGIQSLSMIVTADLVPLRDRGFFTGITGMVYTIGSVSGPFIAGGFAQHATWRWLFYLNLPLCGLAFTVVFLFLQLKSPRESFREKFFKLDWIGNILIISSTCSSILGLTWGGIRYPWSSPSVLVPLILGLVGLGFAFLYEIKWAKQPTIPLVILSNRTSFFGYVIRRESSLLTKETYMHTRQVYRNILARYRHHYSRIPTWFQSVRLAGPVTSGLDFLPMAVAISPSAIAQGLIVAKFGNYRILNFAGWSIMLLGMGLFTTLHVGSPIGVLAIFQIIQGVGMGILYCTYFPIMAPLPLSENASAVALVTFVRTFSQAWGVAISGTILQNGLLHRLPPSLLALYPEHTQLAYAVIPKIASLSPELRYETQKAFAESLHVVWVVMVALCGAGLLSVAFIKEFTLRKTTDKKWGLKEENKTNAGGKDEEASIGKDGSESAKEAGDAEVIELEQK
ncbi:hypothetical protein PHLCEN_2v7050 [Hermanssonia centrifuga]|uniref:Major facilitator superfamily (MFS) profile domain-containing protein n=1 Tax=Hermanssonia centrifuga TaxID=98765 RepID=A0A2R6NXR8_9APHY|nr:hypothetical protein PHLCEN_2v7050 [Hermanssonia centrifuga]